MQQLEGTELSMWIAIDKKNLPNLPANGQHLNGVTATDSRFVLFGGLAD